MGNTLELNRLEFNILKCLYDSGCVDAYHSMTITELLEKYKELEKRMTIYRRLRKLTEEKYVKKGITDNHADSFYLLEKALKIIEGREPNNARKQLMDSKVLYDINSVRTKLVDIMDRGLMLKSIAVNAGISESELSRFKNGVDSLKESDMKLLADYLNAVVIPQWNTAKEPKKQMTARERIMVSREHSNKVESTRHWLFM